MDKNLLLAIYSKVNSIYNISDKHKFLSFPNTFSYSFSPKDLQLWFQDTGSEAARALHFSSDFARTMNSPVRGIIFEEVGDRPLWQVYANILQMAELADITDKDGKARYDEAYSYLYKTTPEGLTTPTEALLRYQKYRDKKFDLEERLQKRESDPQKENPEQLQNELNEVLQEWEVEGNRKEVEEKIRTMNYITSSQPYVIWDQLKKRFNPNLTILTSVENIKFAPTYLFPSDVQEQPWDCITLHEEEIKTLIDTAPERLKVCFPSAEVSDVESLSFEYRSVRIERPWINFDIFKSKFWRFHNDSSEESISYEDRPDLGQFPAYISALLLMRNLVIKRKGSEANKASFSEISDTESKDAKRSDSVTVLAYICKKLPLSPNPAPDALWTFGYNCAQLDIRQTQGGQADVKVDRHYVGSGPVPIGKQIHLSAHPMDNFIFSYWRINGKDYNEKDLVLKMSEEGMSITPHWKISENFETNAFQLSRDGRTLLKWNDSYPIVDMNLNNALSKVTSIAIGAFENNPSLKRIKIGESVNIIEERAFANCNNLELVEIPAQTELIHPEAFYKDDTTILPSFRVDPGNNIYTTSGSMLIERQRAEELLRLQCGCGSTYVFHKLASSKCPICDRTLDTASASRDQVLIPDIYIPFAHNHDRAEELIRSHFRKKFFVSKEFKSLILTKPLTLTPVYIPIWQWQLECQGNFTITINTKKDTGRKDAEGKAVYETTTTTKEKKESLFVEDLTFSASTITKGKAPTFKRTNQKPFEKGVYHEDRLFELYTHGYPASQKEARAEALKQTKSKIKADVPSNSEATVSPKDKEITYRGEKHSLVYVPIWVGAINFKDRRIPLHLNDSTEQVSYSEGYPKSKYRILILILIILLIITAIVLFFIFNK